MDATDFIDRLTRSVANARDLEGLTRPLLHLLEEITGLESTYLTTVDERQGIQKVLLAHNAQTLCIPEGLAVGWSDTLCRRALKEGRYYVEDVPGCWGDSRAAAELGIRTYMSSPVYVAGNELYGTLCAISSQRRPVDEHTQRVVTLFAKLIGQHIERERLLSELVVANAQLSADATTDRVTGLPNRRALLEHLERRMKAAREQGRPVLVAFLDLDGFKEINDRHGHGTGDVFLAVMGQRIQHSLRADDFLARYGGDEFVVVVPGPRLAADAARASQQLAARLMESSAGTFICQDVTIDYAGASAGAVAADPGRMSVQDALDEADKAMYEVKRTRSRRR